MTILVSKAISDVQRQLLSFTRPARNLLNAAVVTSDTSIVLARGTSEGATVPEESWLTVDREIMWVWTNTATTSTQTLSVNRGDYGTTAAAHDTGAITEINPRFARPHIADALKDEIRSWQPNLYQVEVANYAVSTMPAVLDAGPDFTDAYGIASARVQRIANGAVSVAEVSASPLFGMDVSEYPSEVAIAFKPPQTAPTLPATVRVTWTLPFDLETFNDSTDLVDQVGLAASMVDVAVLGASIRLLASREAARSDTTAQGQPRDAAEVAVGAQLQQASGLRSLYASRMADEKAKLLARYPIRFS